MLDIRYDYNACDKCGTPECYAKYCMRAAQLVEQGRFGEAHEVQNKYRDAHRELSAWGELEAVERERGEE